MVVLLRLLKVPRTRALAVHVRHGDRMKDAVKRDSSTSSFIHEAARLCAIHGLTVVNVMTDDEAALARFRAELGSGGVRVVAMPADEFPSHELLRHGRGDVQMNGALAKQLRETRKGGAPASRRQRDDASYDEALQLFTQVRVLARSARVFLGSMWSNVDHAIVELMAACRHWPVTYDVNGAVWAAGYPDMKQTHLMRFEADRIARLSPTLPAWARRRASTTPPPLDRQLFVHIVGVEGAGHHGATQELVLPLLKDRCTNDPQPPGTCRVVYPARKTVRFSDGESEVRAALQKGNLTDVFVEDMSFPSGGAYHGVGKRNTMPKAIDDGRRPRFDHASAYTVLSRVMRLRVIVLQRDFVSIVLTHADYDGGVENHAQLMADHQRHIAAALALLPPHKWRALPMGCANETRARVTMLTELAAFMGVPRLCPSCLQHWRSPTERKSDVTVLSSIRRIEQAHQADWGIFSTPCRGENCERQYLLERQSCARRL